MIISKPTQRYLEEGLSMGVKVATDVGVGVELVGLDPVVMVSKGVGNVQGNDHTIVWLHKMDCE